MQEEEEEEEEDEDEEDEDEEEEADDDLLGLGLGDDDAGDSGAGDTFADLFGSPTPQPVVADVKLHPMVQSSDNKGYEMRAAFVRGASGAFSVRMQFRGAEGKQFAVQFNKNAFGMKPTTQKFNASGGSAEVPVAAQPGYTAAFDSRGVQAAMKCLGVSAPPAYFWLPWELAVLCNPDGKVPGKTFIQQWKSLPAESQVTGMFGGLKTLDVDQITASLEQQNVFFIKRQNMGNDQVACYYSMTLINRLVLLVELRFKANIDGCKMCIKTTDLEVGRFVSAALQQQLQK